MLPVFADELLADSDFYQIAEEAGYIVNGYDEESNTYYISNQLYMDYLINPFSFDSTTVGVTPDSFQFVYSYGSGSITYNVVASIATFDGNAVYISLPCKGYKVFLSEIYCEQKLDNDINLGSEVPVFGLYAGYNYSDLSADSSSSDYDTNLIDESYTLFISSIKDPAIFAPSYIFFDGNTFGTDDGDVFTDVELSDGNASINYYTCNNFVNYNDSILSKGSYFDINYSSVNGGSQLLGLNSNGYSYCNIVIYPSVKASSQLYQQIMDNKLYDDVSNIKDNTTSIDNTSKSIFEKIKELPSTIWNKFENGLKSLFIPEDGWLDEQFNDLMDTFENSLGILGFPFTLLQKFVSLFSSSSDASSYSFTIPKIGWGNYVLCESSSHSFSDLINSADWLTRCFDVFQIMAKFAIILGLVNLARQKLYEILGGGGSE